MITYMDYILKLLGGIGLRIETQLMNSIYVTGKWPKDFTEVKMITINKKPKASKFSHRRTISLIAHTATLAARILRRGFERKTEDVLEEDRLDLEEEEE
jgi:hypothetical protein